MFEIFEAVRSQFFENSAIAEEQRSKRSPSKTRMIATCGKLGRISAKSSGYQRSVYSISTTTQSKPLVKTYEGCVISESNPLDICYIIQSY